MIVYLEGDARIEWPYHHQTQHTLLIRLESEPGMSVEGRPPVTDVSGADDPVFQRAIAERSASKREELRPTQLIVPDSPTGPLLGPPIAPPPTASVSRHVSINPRYLGQQFSANSHVSDSLPPERVITVTNGVNIVVDNVPVNLGGQIMWTTIDLSADSAVIWTDASQTEDLAQGLNLGPDTPFRVYLEGHIVVRQGLNEAEATQAYYDISERRGLLIDAEIRAYVPALDNFLRVRAQQVRQLSESSYHAQNAWFTTSQTGHPGYRIQSSDVYLNERPASAGLNPFSGEQDGSSLWITSLNNRLYVEDVPVFYTPYLSTPAEDPSTAMRQMEFDYNGMFGFSVRSAWSLRGLGVPLPDKTQWDLQLDYMSLRGPALGTLFNYDQQGSLFGMPMRNAGFGNLFYVNDSGTDNLGFGRRSLNVPNDNRGRALWRNRTIFGEDSWLTGTRLDAELGYVSDRNFREQFFEPEWDRDKDQETLLNLYRHYDNWTISGMTRTRLVDFEYQTNWYPRIDLTGLGEPLLNNLLSWSSHSSIGCGLADRRRSVSDRVSAGRRIDSKSAPRVRVVRGMESRGGLAHVRNADQRHVMFRVFGR